MFPNCYSMLTILYVLDCEITLTVTSVQMILIIDCISIALSQKIREQNRVDREKRKKQLNKIYGIKNNKQIDELDIGRKCDRNFEKKSSIVQTRHFFKKTCKSGHIKLIISSFITYIFTAFGACCGWNPSLKSSQSVVMLVLITYRVHSCLTTRFLPFSPIYVRPFGMGASCSQKVIRVANF